SRRRHTRSKRDWSSDVCSSDLGLIILSGARHGDVGQLLLSGRTEQAVERARWWQGHFPDHYYLELQRTEHADDEAVVQASLQVRSEERRVGKEWKAWCCVDISR